MPLSTPQDRRSSCRYARAMSIAMKTAQSRYLLMHAEDQPHLLLA
ncbi:hypothetical protein SynA1524_00125 [Synechococcus sp. A15-24]|nr:hypothetical protein SynA1524_00125 [Synechococcus sp. A15-24]